MEEIITELSGNVLRVHLNRPWKKNAMTLAMYAALAEERDRADKNDDVRVAPVRVAGDSFTAGNDIANFVSHPLAPGDSPHVRFLDALIRFSKPLIAAVHGIAVGGGTTMLLHFDFVYAAKSTTFQVPFITLALVPELASSYTMPAQLGYLGVRPCPYGACDSRRTHPFGRSGTAGAHFSASRSQKWRSGAARPHREGCRSRASRWVGSFGCNLRNRER